LSAILLVLKNFLKKFIKPGLPFSVLGINEKQLKIKVMKFVKFSIFALTMGLFVASCGNSSSEETTVTDTTATMAAPAPAPVDSAAMVAPVDTMHHDSASAAPAAH
jgi:hypothetical protein